MFAVDVLVLAYWHFSTQDTETPDDEDFRNWGFVVVLLGLVLMNFGAAIAGKMLGCW
jgi:hypothetical protein